MYLIATNTLLKYGNEGVSTRFAFIWSVMKMASVCKKLMGRM
jgi:hypothetical protein